MPISALRGKVESLPIKKIILDDFSGGLDLTNDPVGLDPRFQIQLTNAVVVGGKATARAGTALAAVQPPSSVDYFYESAALGRVYGIRESSSSTTIYRTTNPFSVAWTTVAHNPGPASLVDSDCVEFNGVLLFITPSGLWSLDSGDVWTQLNATVAGKSIAVWQNKIWVAGTGKRVYYSKAGDPATWDALDYVDINEGYESADVLGLHATQMMDIQGRGALLVGKKRSVHRIHDPTTGAFSTLSHEVGWIHKRAVVSGGGASFFIDRTGIYETDGVSRPAKISQRIDPFFNSGTSLYALSNVVLPQVAPVYHNGRFLFSFPGYNPFTNSVVIAAGAHRTVEYDPETGAFTKHEFSDLDTGGNQGRVQAWLSPRYVPTVVDQPELLVSDHVSVWRAFTSTAELTDKAVIQTPYLELAGGMRFRIHRVRVVAKLTTLAVAAPFTLRVRRDGVVSDSITRTLTSGGTTPPSYQAFDFNRLGDCRNVSLVFELPIRASVSNTTPTDDPYSILTRQYNAISKVIIEYTPTGRN